MGFSVLGFAVPVFLVGYLLIYVFAIQLRWLPVQGYRPLARGHRTSTLRSIALPAFALGMVYMALIARITRASMLEVLSEDYIRTARAKGVATRRGAAAPRPEERRGADRDRRSASASRCSSRASSSPRPSSTFPVSAG